MIEAQTASDVGKDSEIQTRDIGHAQDSAANESRMNQDSRRLMMSSRRLPVPVFFLFVLMVVLIGWQYNRFLYLTPEQGLGYVLGIVGASLMAMLLLYPLRKHARWARGIGPVRYWFRSHMLMGVVGPVCILFHCNFQLGSTNGNIALFSMLLVAGSGLVGRYFYTKIHYGLYGRKADLVHLGSDTIIARAELDPVFNVVPEMKARLQRLEDAATLTQGGFLSCLARVLVINIRSRWCWLVSVIELRKFFNVAYQQKKLTREQCHYYFRKNRYFLSIYMCTVRKVAGFLLFERLFSMWHIFHLPIFVMLLITGTVHVYAVHMY